MTYKRCSVKGCKQPSTTPSTETNEQIVPLCRKHFMRAWGAFHEDGEIDRGPFRLKSGEKLSIGLILRDLHALANASSLSPSDSPDTSDVFIGFEPATFRLLYQSDASFVVIHSIEFQS